MSEPRLACAFSVSLADADYLTGRMSDEEVEAFERHLLECGECGERLEAAALLRAAMALAGVASPTHPTATKRRFWTRPVPWLVAATLAVGVGLFLWLPTSPPPLGTEPLRGVEDRLDVAVRVQGGRIEVSWPELPAASSYLVELLDAGGDAVLSREATEPRLDIEAADLGSARDLRLRVLALDAVGQPIVTSPPLPIPR